MQPRHWSCWAIALTNNLVIILSLEYLDLKLKQNQIDIRHNQYIIENKGKQLREFQSEF